MADKSSNPARVPAPKKSATHNQLLADELSEAKQLLRVQENRIADLEYMLKTSSEIHARYSAALEELGIGVTLISPDYRTIWASPSIRRVFGDVEGKPCFAAYTRRLSICPNCGVREVLTRSVPHAVHVQVGRDMNDRPIWSEITAIPLMNESGEISAVLEVFVPITEKMRMEEALLASERRLHLIAEHMQDIVMQSDADFLITYISPSATRALGHSRDEMVGKHILSFVHPDDVTPTQDSIRTATAAHEEKLVLEHRLCHKSGAWLWMETQATLLYSSAGVYTGAIASTRDITDRKIAEEQRLKLEQRLQRAEKMEALGTLAGGVAHDLNNILSGIVSYPDLLLLQIPQHSPLRRPLLSIKTSGERAASIVGDLLSLARRGIATKSLINCNELIKEYLNSPEFLHLKNQHPNVCFLTDLDPALMHITAAPVQLAKCLMNLVANAAESIQETGEVRIHSRNHYVDQSAALRCGLKEGDYISISVADTGTGIGMKDREHIFEPFYTKKKMGRSGSGLGLAVVWNTVQEHQGQILVESEMEKGTTFTMHLPATREKLSAAPYIKSHAAYRGNGEHILIVDDVGEQREIAGAILAQLGYRVAAAANGEEAITYLSRRQVDLVLLDMMMPGMDGFETYKRILRIRPGQRALVVSGYSENSRVTKTLELGAGALVKKPYLIETLGLAVRKELSASSPKATL